MKITQVSYTRKFDRGVKASETVGALAKVSHGQDPEEQLQQVKDWVEGHGYTHGLDDEKTIAAAAENTRLNELLVEARLVSEQCRLFVAQLQMSIAAHIDALDDIPF